MHTESRRAGSPRERGERRQLADVRRRSQPAVLQSTSGCTHRRRRPCDRRFRLRRTQPRLVRRSRRGCRSWP